MIFRDNGDPEPADTGSLCGFTGAPAVDANLEKR
jgi:hypothetical protein